ncbi:MAG: type IX secretion system protein PorQ [Bernardetiaceae bacterium]|nr:type IX secretion system protein PorQ [Bernardetiaceae bacterium]
MPTFYRFFILILLFFLVSDLAYAQLGGRRSFEFLNMATHGRTIGLGGVNITSDEDDVQMIAANPALLQADMHGKLSMSFYPYYAGVSNISLAYAHDFGNRQFGITLQYLNYGEMDAFDPSGNAMGTFSANDFALGIVSSHQIDNFRIGGQLKLVGSRIEGYGAGGVFMDLGGVFVHPEEDLKFGLNLKNMGFLWSNYTPTSSFEMPFDAQLGISYRPAKMPVRFSLTLHQLVRGNIALENPNAPVQLDANGNPIDNSVSNINKMMRRVVLGTEFLLGESFRLRAGYNFLRRSEMILTDRPALVGFSFGMMLRVKGFEVAYARSLHHISGGVNNFTLAVAFDKILKPEGKRSKTVID